MARNEIMMKWRFSHMGCADLFKCSMFIFFCVLGTFMVLEKMFQIGYYCNNRIFCDPTQTHIHTALRNNKKGTSSLLIKAQ